MKCTFAALAQHVRGKSTQSGKRVIMEGHLRTFLGFPASYSMTFIWETSRKVALA